MSVIKERSKNTVENVSNTKSNIKSQLSKSSKTNGPFRKPASLIAITSRAAQSNSNPQDSFSTINEKELRQEMYGKDSKESRNATVSFTKISERRASLSQSTNSSLKSIEQIPSHLKNDIRYTKLYLHKQGLHNMSM